MTGKCTFESQWISRSKLDHFYPRFFVSLHLHLDMDKEEAYQKYLTHIIRFLILAGKQCCNRPAIGIPPWLIRRDSTSQARYF
jgi:hypothetical protein